MIKFYYVAFIDYIHAANMGYINFSLGLVSVVELQKKILLASIVARLCLLLTDSSTVIVGRQCMAPWDVCCYDDSK